MNQAGPVLDVHVLRRLRSLQAEGEPDIVAELVGEFLEVAPGRLERMREQLTAGDAHGLEFTNEELPDFLPAVLEFASRTGNIGMLTEHRDALDQLRSRLTAFGTPYACVLDAVCATLPPAPTGARP